MDEILNIIIKLVAALLAFGVGWLVKYLNTLIERTYKLEEEYAIHDEKIRVANHRIDDLEKRAGE